MHTLYSTGEQMTSEYECDALNCKINLYYGFRTGKCLTSNALHSYSGFFCMPVYSVFFNELYTVFGFSNLNQPHRQDGYDSIMMKRNVLKKIHNVSKLKIHY